jgi:beta-N-acetylhexosaminidase
LGVRSPELSKDMAAFFKDASPWGFVLFREACVSKPQVTKLCDDIREAVGHDALIYIDQEGGRVARLKAPEWPVWPALAVYGEIYKKNAKAGLEASWLHHRLIARELRAIGLDGCFAPVIDTPVSGADPVIGDRAFSTDPKTIAALGQAAMEGLCHGGVSPCIKHIPGHGRANVDSHLALPRVTASERELERDILPFAELADAPAAMTAHIVYDAWDEHMPATCSPFVIKEIIREKIGFQGLLISDDLDMKALELIVAEGLRGRAEAALEAGCDVVLQCSGVLEDMIETAEGCSALSGISWVRARAAQLFGRRPQITFDADAGWSELKTLLGDAFPSKAA